MVICVCLFQSTPVIADGRRFHLLLYWRALTRFNPRPSLLTGDASVMASPSAAVSVSIHARHC